MPGRIDTLRWNYLALEHDLWTLMDSGIDTAYVLEQIHIVHLKVFGERFGEFNVSFNDCAAEHQFQLKHTIAEINRTISIVIKNYLHQNPLAFDEMESIAIGNRQRNLTNQLDLLFGVAGSSEFFETIKSVSFFLSSNFC